MHDAANARVHDAPAHSFDNVLVVRSGSSGGVAGEARSHRCEGLRNAAVELRADDVGAKNEAAQSHQRRARALDRRRPASYQ